VYKILAVGTSVLHTLTLPVYYLTSGQIGQPINISTMPLVLPTTLHIVLACLLSMVMWLLCCLMHTSQMKY